LQLGQTSREASSGARQTGHVVVKDKVRALYSETGNSETLYSAPAHNGCANFSGSKCKRTAKLAKNVKASHPTCPTTTEKDHPSSLTRAPLENHSLRLTAFRLLGVLGGLGGSTALPGFLIRPLTTFRRIHGAWEPSLLATIQTRA
jgi:hypothetical protein